MIETMVSAIVENLAADLEGRPATARHLERHLSGRHGRHRCGLRGPAADPAAQCQLVQEGQGVHLAKIGFEKYFLRKMRKGSAEPLFEKYVLKSLGIVRLQTPSQP